MEDIFSVPHSQAKVVRLLRYLGGEPVLILETETACDGRHDLHLEDVAAVEERVL